MLVSLAGFPPKQGNGHIILDKQYDCIHVLSSTSQLEPPSLSLLPQEETYDVIYLFHSSWASPHIPVNRIRFQTLSTCNGFQ